MPPAAGGSAPDPDLENNDACWRAKPRANRRHCFPQGVSKGAQPLCRRRHSSSLLLNVYATVACRRRLQKAPRRIHERLPRTHSRPAQGLDKDPKLVWDMLEAGNAKARARASRNLDALKKKLNFIFREGRKMPPAAGGLSPRTSTWKIMTPVGARSRAPTGVIVFPKGGFQRGSALCRRRHSSSLLLNVYATVACRRRLQKAPRRIHERLPRTHSRPAQGLDKDPKLVWDMLEAGNAKARARASRNLDALKKKLNFIF